MKTWRLTMLISAILYILFWELGWLFEAIFFCAAIYGLYDMWMLERIEYEKKIALLNIKVDNLEDGRMS